MKSTLRAELVRIPEGLEEEYRRRNRDIPNIDRLRLYQIRLFQKGPVSRLVLCVGIFELTINHQTGDFLESGCILSHFRGIDLPGLFETFTESNFTEPVKKALAALKDCAVKVGETRFVERYYFARKQSDRERLKGEFSTPKGKEYIQLSLDLTTRMMVDFSEE